MFNLPDNAAQSYWLEEGKRFPEKQTSKQAIKILFLQTARKSQSLGQPPRK
jgi:hypothetical protein